MSEKYYIMNMEGKPQEVTENEAKEQFMYMVKHVESGHLFECYSEHNATSREVHDKMCWLCGGHVESLTTECCHSRLSDEELDKIYKGKLDYRYGRWLKGVVPKTRIKGIDDVRLNQTTILKILAEDLKGNEELSNKVAMDVLHELLAWREFVDNNYKEVASMDNTELEQRIRYDLQFHGMTHLQILEKYKDNPGVDVRELDQLICKVESEGENHILMWEEETNSKEGKRVMSKITCPTPYNSCLKDLFACASCHRQEKLVFKELYEIE